MILINLLPHREAKRRRRKQTFFVGIGVAAAIGAVIGVIWYGAMSHLLDVQERRNQDLETANQKLNAQIKDIASLRTEIDALRARQKAVEDLQTDRNTPVRLLDELVKHVPEGVYITSLKQNGNQVDLGGVAQTNERVSEFLRNLLYSAKWLEQPELIESKSTVLPVNPGSKEMRRLYQYQLKVRIKQPVASGAAGAAASAASAPVRSR